MAICAIKKEVLRLIRSGMLGQRSNSKELLKPLLQAMSKLSEHDLQPVLQDYSRHSPSRLRRAPVTYISILDQPDFIMCVFVLNKPTSELPLHDHPGMHGALKVVKGSLTLTCYDVIDSCSDGDDTLCAKVTHSGIVTPSDPPLHLTPTCSNLHSLRGVQTPCAFFDVLMPRYEPPERDCSYFQRCPDAKCSKELEGHVKLKRLPGAPSSYWCDELVFSSGGAETTPV